jgi:hypothetical protein
MCCKSWPLWLGLLGLCVAGVILRNTDDARAEPPPPEVIQANPHVEQPKEVTTQPNHGRNHQTTTKNVFVSVVAKPPSPPVFETKADGYGVKEEDATDNAIKDACRQVEMFLARQYGETFTPTEDELKSKQIVGPAEFETANTPVANDAAKTTMLRAIVPVKLTAEQVKEFREEARKHRLGGRMKTAGVVLAGMIALLLVGGGYLRLEEATKGYYTTLLRVGAVTVLGILVLSLLTLTNLWN